MIRDISATNLKDKKKKKIAADIPKKKANNHLELLD